MTKMEALERMRLLLIKKQTLSNAPRTAYNLCMLVKILAEIEQLRRQFRIRLEPVKRKETPVAADVPWYTN